jgi:hypothetical protein
MLPVMVPVITVVTLNQERILGVGGGSGEQRKGSDAR